MYYEVDNARARKFFIEELRPTFEHLREAIDLDLIPYGRTQFDGTQFTCPNGKDQCLGNKIQVILVTYL